MKGFCSICRMPLSAFEAAEGAWCCAKCLDQPYSPSPEEIEKAAISSAIKSATWSSPSPREIEKPARDAQKAAARLEAHNKAVARLAEEREILADRKRIADNLNSVERASLMALASNDYLLLTQLRDVINRNTKLNASIPRINQALASLAKKDLIVFDRFSESEEGWRLTEYGDALAEQLPPHNWSIHADVPQSMSGAARKYQWTPRVESVVGHYGARKGG